MWAQELRSLYQWRATRTTRTCWPSACWHWWPCWQQSASGLDGQEVNAKKSLAFSATSSMRGKPLELRATLDGVEFPVQLEFRQMGVGKWEFRQMGVHTGPKRGTGPVLKQRIADGKMAL